MSDNCGNLSPLSTLRHSAAHVMAHAVQELWPGVKIAIGPAIEDGFYYDFDKGEPFTTADLEAIENRMREIVEARHPFERTEVSREEARSLFEGQPYKIELIDDLPDGEQITTYTDGSFVDLCRGPHVSNTGEVKVFKLLSVAGAYWRGDSSRPMLQRIYGTAFETQEELEQYLERVEEARKRDHKRLGRELELFAIIPEIGAGLPVWLPKGATAVTIEGTRHRAGVWNGQPVTSEHPVAFTVFVVCAPTYSDLPAVAVVAARQPAALKGLASVFRKAAIAALALLFFAPAAALLGVGVLMNPAANASCGPTVSDDPGPIPDELEVTTRDGETFTLNKKQLTHAATIITVGLPADGDDVLVRGPATPVPTRISITGMTKAEDVEILIEGVTVAVQADVGKNGICNRLGEAQGLIARDAVLFQAVLPLKGTHCSLGQGPVSPVHRKRIAQGAQRLLHRA